MNFAHRPARLFALALGLFGLAVPGALLAQSPSTGDMPSGDLAGPSIGPINFDAEVGIVTDFRYRGVSRSDEDPALQAAVSVGHESGFYVGARGSTIDGHDPFLARNPAFQDLGDAQLDLHAGFGAPIGAGFEVDGGVQYHVFTGGQGETDFVEPYASLSWLIGPAYASVGARWAPSQDAIGNEDMLYLFGQLDVAIPFRPWRFNLLVGHQDWGAYGEYWTWSAGVEHRLRIGPLPAADIGISYVDTDLPAIAGQDAGLVGSLRLRF